MQLSKYFVSLGGVKHYIPVEDLIYTGQPASDGSHFPDMSKSTRNFLSKRKPAWLQEMNANEPYRKRSMQAIDKHCRSKKRGGDTTTKA